jgi:transcriptional regulator with XRE-family HTH domain
MKNSRAQSALPLVVTKLLKKLGGDISIARRRRNVTIAVIADRAFISRNTVTRIESGDPGVSLGIYATVLFVLGLADRLDGLLDPASDALGLALESERLPIRARVSRPGKG